MARLLPKAVAENSWKQLPGNRVYAFRSGPGDVLYFRLGQGKSFYLEVSPTQLGGRILNSVEYDSGTTNLLYKLSTGGTLTIGRASPCQIKILHAYMSRQHIEYSLDGDILLVRDFGSINGSFYHADSFCFDVEKYLENHPISLSAGETLDEIHEIFGPMLDDFLKRYLRKKENKNDTIPDNS